MSITDKLLMAHSGQKTLYVSSLPGAYRNDIQCLQLPIIQVLAPYHVLVHACSPQVTYIDSSPQQMTQDYYVQLFLNSCGIRPEC